MEIRVNENGVKRRKKNYGYDRMDVQQIGIETISLAFILSQQKPKNH